MARVSKNWLEWTVFGISLVLTGGWLVWRARRPPDP